MKTKIRLALLGAVTLLSGCQPPLTRTEADYGASVRQMINAQTYNPATLNAPNAAPVVGADPYMVNAAVKELQEGVTSRKEESEPIAIEFSKRSK